MGLSPRQVDDLTAWEFTAAVAGWRLANSPEQGPSPPSPEEHDLMMAKYA